MLLKSYISTQFIHVIHFNEITQYTNMVIVGGFLILNHFFTYQRKGTQELQVQAVNNILAGSQNQINNFTFVKN